jgi:hypothetical protein
MKKLLNSGEVAAMHVRHWPGASPCRSGYSFTRLSSLSSFL